MSDLERIQKIIDAHKAKRKKWPYCFRKLRPKLIKFSNTVTFS